MGTLSRLDAALERQQQVAFPVFIARLVAVFGTLARQSTFEAKETPS